ncbi:MAG: hypothetical protein RLZZ401_434 [Pseudomonadota bacterium]|jgi:fatty-acyl-CoA synthase
MPPAAPAPRFSHLSALLAHQAQQRPQALAWRFEGQDTDYAAAWQRCRGAAHRLATDWQVRPGDRVAYLGLNHPDQLVLLFALAHLGAMLVPLNFRLAGAEWRAVLADSASRCLLHDAHWAAAATALAQADGLAAHPLHSLVPATPCPMPACAGQPGSPALLVYTSGTTGQARGAVHTQANLLANMQAAQAVQDIQPADRVLTVLPMFHVGGLCIQTLPALYAGASVLLHARFDAGTTLQALASDRPSLTLQVPATLRALLAHADWGGTDLSSLRALWAGSSLLPDDLVQAVQARGVPVCNVYGATETGPVSLALPPAQALSHLGSCGWPAPGVEARIEAPRDGVGELWLRAPAIVQHYWPAQPTRDAKGWFHTGDLARQAVDGSFSIVGRAKDMIISGGENIYPAEIENLLATHPAVADCAVLGLPDAAWGELPVAVLVLRDEYVIPGNTGGTLSLLNWEQLQAELTAWLQTRLARYKLPRRWFVQTALPRTALGKVQKEQLRQSLPPSRSDTP